MTVLPEIYLVRHGETAWTMSAQHTGRTDIPLTERGEREAQELSARLDSLTFAEVLTSPLQRARRTGELAGFAACVHADPDLMEWDYGAYEGRRSSDIRAERPGWDPASFGATTISPSPSSTSEMAASRPQRVPGD